MSMGIKIFQVDAFTGRPFSGNPAAVCILPHPKDEQWMRQVAREMNLSETAFLLREGKEFRLRWFTPQVEVDLCGHATLASAHILWEEGYLKVGEARFLTRSGPLKAVRRGEWIELDFPAEREEKAIPPPELERALGVVPKYVGKNRMDYLVEVESGKILREIQPDFFLLAGIPVRGVIVTAPSDSRESDFLSRFFAPRCGIPEDPVTGSSHCCLGPFWQARLKKNELTGGQVSFRGGSVHVRMEGDRVLIGGEAVTVLRSELTV